MLRANRKKILLRLELFERPFFEEKNEKISNVLNIVFIIYVLLMPFSKAFNYVTGPYIILALWILEGGMKEKVKFLLKPLFLIWFVFIIFTLTSLLWAEPDPSQKQLLRAYFAFTVIAVAFSTSLKSGYFKYIIYVFIGTMAINEIISYGIFFEWWSFEHRSRMMPNPPKIHHIRYSVFLAITAMMLIWRIMAGSENKKIKIIESIFFLSVLTNLFLNGGRTGQLDMLVGFMVFSLLYFKPKILLYFKPKIKNILLLFVLMTFTIISMYQISPVFKARVGQGINDIKLLTENNYNSSWGRRVARYIAIERAVREKPFIGYGLGNFHPAMRTLDSKFKNIHPNIFKIAQNSAHPHSDYLQILVQSGYLGLLLYLSFFFSILLKVLEERNRTERAIYLSLLSILLVSSFTNPLLKDQTIGLFAFVIGMILNRIYGNASHTMEEGKRKAYQRKVIG